MGLLSTVWLVKDKSNTNQEQLVITWFVGYTTGEEYDGRVIRWTRCVFRAHKQYEISST